MDGSLRQKEENNMGIQQHNAREKISLIRYILEKRRGLEWTGRRFAIFCRKENFKPFLSENDVLGLRRLRVLIDIEVIVAGAIALDKEEEENNK